MCGIAGFWSRSGGNANEALLQMAGALCHRGPDDSGLWADDAAGIGLAHRRLAIIDLSAHGHQPKQSASGRFVTVYNGEIYNYHELRDELRGLGFSFAGESDTEVVLAAFEQWGVAAGMARCAGMFALAVWDRRDRRLWLARDRMGEKPLYYGWMGDTLLFGSELKSLRAHPAWRGEVDRAAVADFLRMGYVPAPRSIFRGIHKLAAGTLASFDVGRDQREPEHHVFWSLAQVAERGRRAPFAGSDAEATQELDVLLRRVVDQEMMSDVPLGAFLSGGIDSSLVVALMQAQRTNPVRTFTIGFHEKGYDEAQHAKAVARHLGTDHTELYVTESEAQHVIPRLPAIYDEPFADPSQIPTFLVSQMARRAVTVSLSGDGGDELFGGYNRYFMGMRLWRAFAPVPRPARRVAAQLVRAVSPRSWDRVAHAASRTLPVKSPPAFGDKIHKAAEVFVATDTGDLYRRLTTHWHDASRIVIGAGQNGSASIDGTMDFASGMMLADALNYLPDDVLVKVDRASMAVSLESRAPFLHHEVVEFAWTLPLTMKVRNGRGKWVLRQLLDRYVPRSLIERPKMGFGVPIDVWLRGPLREWGEALLSEDRLRREGIFEPSAIRVKWQEHLSGTRNWQYLLWDILMFQAWSEHGLPG